MCTPLCHEPCGPVFFPSQTLSICLLSGARLLAVSLCVCPCSCLCLRLGLRLILPLPLPLVFCFFLSAHLCVMSYRSRFPSLFLGVPAFFVRALVSSLCRLRPFMKSSSAWTAMSVFASHDSKVVYRSGSILGYPENFRYKEVVSFKVRCQGEKGRWWKGEYCSNAIVSSSPFAAFSCTRSVR